MKKIKVISCIPTVAVMAMIFFFSAQTAAESSNTSLGITKRIAETIADISGATGSENVQQIEEVLHVIVRKAAHFLMFFVLGLCSINTAVRCFEWKNKKNFIYSVFFCLFYALSDEIHQHFVPGRATMLIDVLIDFSGSICGCGVFIIVRNILLRRRKNDL